MMSESTYSSAASDGVAPPLAANGQRDGDGGAVAVPLKPLSLCLEEVVISGASGRFPESDSVRQFGDNLLTGVDMVTDDGRRFTPGIYGLPKRCGKVNELKLFDASFFGVSPKQADRMDPQLRTLLELTFETLIDAGVSPQLMRGTRTGVFVGVSSSECDYRWSQETDTQTGYALTGTNSAMFANRVSYSFNFTGPSYSVDTACSSSLVALNNALQCIRTGQCDAAIVAGLNLCLRPESSLCFDRLGMLAADGKCKAFDASGNGYVRSEAMVSVLLQRRSDARRVYATLVHSKTNCDGFKQQGVTYPSTMLQRQLMRQVYREAGVDPRDVVYVEAHGTGTKVGDPVELNAITDVFCTDRADSLLIGSVKSNMGHSEPASGLCAIVKVLLAMEHGVIPGNLHYNEPNPNIPGLLDGRLKVVAENTPFSGGYVGVNSFGFGGANVHVLLRGGRSVVGPEATLPAAAADGGDRLTLASGRTEQAVTAMLQPMSAAGDNADLWSLISSAHSRPIAGHLYRGYTVAGSGQVHVKRCEADSRPPIWYICSGMGSQWPGMGRDLMALPIFSQAINRCAEALKPHGVCLLDLIYCDDTAQVVDNTLHAFVLIASVQVGLIDVLRAVGLAPDGIVGHSVGELGCAYADGCFTAEQTVLCAYWRGRCISEARLKPGAMAALGMSWQEAADVCPKGVFPACQNAADSVTVSGPCDLVHQLVEQLQQRGVFARLVNSSGVAFHTSYIEPAASQLRTRLQKVIPAPKARTAHWISSSIGQDKWHTPLAKLSSVDYHVNNLLSPVLFHDALQHVPAGAVLVEVAPHCLLQAVLKRSVPGAAAVVPLNKRPATSSATSSATTSSSGSGVNNVHFLLASLGTLYQLGADPDVSALYPPVPRPVHTGTPPLAHTVHWDHKLSWDVADFRQGWVSEGETVVKVDLSSEQDEYLAGHTIDGRVLYPATGYLVQVWRVLAKHLCSDIQCTPVVFSDVSFKRATILGTGVVQLSVSLLDCSGRFEVCEAGAVVVDGHVHTVPTSTTTASASSATDSLFSPAYALLQQKATEPAAAADCDDSVHMTRPDVYKELRLRGYEYTGLFQGINSAHLPECRGELSWQGAWVPYLDTLLQFHIVCTDSRQLCLPTRIQRMAIDPVALTHCVQAAAEADVSPSVWVVSDQNLSTVASAGVEIRGMKASLTARRPLQQSPVLEDFAFFPHYDKNVLEDTNVVDVLAPLADLIAENTLQLRSVMRAAELCGSSSSGGGDDSWLTVVTDRLNSVPLTTVEGVAITVGDTGNETASATAAAAAAAAAAGGGGRSAVSSADSLHWDPSSQKLPVTGLDLLILDGHSGSDAAGGDGGGVTCQLGQKQLYDMIASSVRLGGFVLTATKLDTKLDIGTEYTDMDSSGPVWRLVSIADKRCSDGRCRLYRLRECVRSHRGIAVSERPLDLWIEVRTNDDKFNWVKDVQEGVKHLKANTSDRLFLSCSGLYCGLLGLISCLKRESGYQQVRAVFHSTSYRRDPGRDCEVIKCDLVSSCLMDDEGWGSYRHQLRRQQQLLEPSRHAFINTLQRGDLSTLSWIQSDDLYADKVTLCCVHYAPLNFRDIMLATGKLSADALPGDLASQECVLGLEFSGVCCATSQRVMGLVPARGLATTVSVDPDFLWEVPADWSLEQAATVPVVYSTAYYSLLVRGRLRSGQSVLIHSGSGGVGQAAIAIALSMKCDVFTTIGTSAKKQFLLENFPELKPEQIFNSRDLTFETGVLGVTRGRGVDLVLNSLSGQQLLASVRCLAQHGTFLEIGKYDLSQNSSLGMSVFLKNITFHGILLDAIFGRGEPDAKCQVTRLVSEGLTSGVVRPLPRRVFSRQQIEQAFRFMAAGKHIGKVMIKVSDDDDATGGADDANSRCVATQPSLQVPALYRSYADPQASYVITGGLGGFGLELAEWLVTRGARYLILVSRSGVRTGYQASRLRSWRLRGVEVTVSRANIANFKEAVQLINEADCTARLDGIFHLAMVLRDSLFENQTPEMFEQVAEAKVKGTINLDRASRDTSVKWFVVFSSVSCGRGNAGQTSYGYANSVMERVIEKRNEDGLCGLAVQWGAVGDVGVVMDTMKGDNSTAVGGTMPQRIASCLHTLDGFLSESGVVSSMVLPDKTASVGGGGGVGSVSLVDTVANILGLKDSSKVEQTASLADLGLDSLMNVELKQILERDFDLTLDSNQIRNLTFDKLRELSSTASPAAVTDGKDVDMPPADSATATSTATATATAAAGDKLGAPVVTPRRGTIIDNTSLFIDSETGHYDCQLLMPSRCIVPIAGSTDDDHHQKQQPPLYFVHAIEGTILPMQEMLSKLNVRVFGIQCTANCPCSDIVSLAAHYIKVIRETGGDGERFHLAGYSYGAAVVYEMVVRLELAGQPAPLSVTLVEGSPSFVRLLASQYRNQEVAGALPLDEQRQISALEAITMALLEINLSQLRKDLLALTTLEERMQCVASLFIQSGYFSHTHLLYDVIRCLLMRVVSSHSYQPSQRVACDLVLIRAELNDSCTVLGADYGLGQLCSGTVRVETVPGDHTTCLRNSSADRVAALVRHAYHSANDRVSQ